MKNLAYLAISVTFLFTACKKEGFDKSAVDVGNEGFGNEDPVMTLESNYDSRITTPIEKSDDYEYNTSGVVEYSKDGNVIATLDYGDGTKDVWANLEMNGSKKVVDLSAKKKDTKYKKVIAAPLIKTEGCDYIVSGVIKYFKGKKWVATVDYGDGTCDEWATKTWKGGSKTFSLKKVK